MVDLCRLDCGGGWVVLFIGSRVLLGLRDGGWRMDDD